MNHKQVLKSVYFFVYAGILFFWFQGSLVLFKNPDVSSIALAIARFCGLTAVFCVLTQLLLIGRIKWIERVWGHDKLAQIHHKVGRYVLYFIVLHFLFIVSSYSLSAKVSPLTQIATFLTTYDELLETFIAFLLFIGIAVSSIYISKLKLKYETWYYVHLCVYLAILLAYTHQIQYGGTLAQNAFALFWQLLYVFVIGNFLLFRFGMPLYFFYTHRFFVKSVKKGSGDTTIIVISGKNMEAFRRLPGQFVIVRFLDKKRLWQAHPFSISWGTNNSDIRLCAKDSGDFTHELSGLQANTSVLVDGPHGSFTVDPNTQKLLLIAGGIGITPINSILETYAGQKDIVFFYSNKTHESVPLLTEVTARVAHHKIPSYFFYSEDKNPPKGSIEGRIDEKVLKQKVKDISSRSIYICGPEGFIYAMRDYLQALHVRPENIHFEIFSFH